MDFCIALCLIAGGVHAVSSSSRLLSLGDGKDEGFVVLALFTEPVNSLSPDSKLTKISLFSSRRVSCFVLAFFPAPRAFLLPLPVLGLGLTFALTCSLFPVTILGCHAGFGSFSGPWLRVFVFQTALCRTKKSLVHLPFVLEEGSWTSLLISSIASQHFSIICDRISCIRPPLVQHQVLPHVCWSNLIQENAHPELFSNYFSHLCLIFSFAFSFPLTQIHPRIPLT